MDVDVPASLLRSHYPIVQTLSKYLSDILLPRDDSVDDDAEKSFETAVDPPDFLEFMTTTLVATKDKPLPRAAPFTVFSPKHPMKDVVSQAQQRLLSSRRKGVLTAGFFLNKRLGSPAVSGNNSIPHAFQTAEWSMLLDRVGVDPIMHLLMETSLFLSLPNGCLCQLTGEPITAVPLILNPELDLEVGVKKRPAPELECNPRPWKRKRLFDERTNAKAAKEGNLKVPGTIFRTSPQDLRLARSRLFFSRPSHVPHTNIIVVGLPMKHILNQMYPTPSNTPGLDPDEDPLAQAYHARQLIKYIFPGQYGLSTPFNYVAQRKNYVYPNYLDRGVEITTLGRAKTPPRLKDVLPLADKMIWRHRKCDYKALRNLACPTKIQDEGKRLDESVILELMSEQSIQICSQLSLRLDDVSMDSAGMPISPLRATQLSRLAQYKPRFTEFECSHYEVYRYCKLVTNAVIPKAFWGSEANYRLVLQNVREFVELRRHETFTLHRLLQRFSTSACEWLMPSGKRSHTQGRVSVSDALKRRELLEEFMFWYFDGFLMPLLKTTFYITESSAYRNKILYFRQDDWQTLCAPLTKRLLDTMFVRVPDGDVPSILEQSDFGFSFVRLLPKDTGVRPIVNLRGSKSGQGVTGQGMPSVNNVLKTAFDILTYERKNREYLLGASVLGNDQIYVQLKQLKESLTRTNGELPKLYFVKVDVQACFDTIEQTKLLEIIRELLSESEYCLHQYAQVQYANGKAKRRYRQRRATPLETSTAEPYHFAKLAGDLAADLWNTVIVNQPMYKPSASRHKIIRLLEEHITQNMVKIGGHYYKQRVGIPQGSILSTMLCSFFYGDLERKDERLLRLRNDPGSLLMRLVDDYLFVTTSVHKARLFLDVMNKGHPEYGCFIGKDKTLTNVDYDVQIMNLIGPSQKSFPWCGHLINMRDLSVTSDYSRYGTWGIANTLTVDTGRAPGSTFLSKMLLLARFRCHVLYTDTSLNGENGAYLNLYQHMLLTALKLREYVCAARLLSRGNSAFIFKAIQKVVSVAYSFAQTQIKRKSKLNGGNPIPCAIKKPAAIWLAYHAFHHVLACKAQTFKAVLPLLERELNGVQNRRHALRFRALIKAGQKAFNFGAIRHL